MVPGTTTILFAILSLVPFRLPGFGSIAPSFVLMAAYHWTLYRPDLLPLGTIFLAGLLLDLLNGTPYVGLSALVLLVARSAVLGQRRLINQRSFGLIWLGFFAVSVGAFAFEWGFVSLMQLRPLAPRPFIFQALVTTACYPVGSYLLALAHRAVPSLGSAR
jgi:rod shape-determining protein MreD